ncbi:TadE/TadG family type IV pilus assembly protein [Pseudodonghicola xiamenensis]|uniref:TadE-like domain-containing protein n=1 Tax=Pseudodonghicola xiamenensis TaxID=337702 RepID=A0A8J3MDT7_9RHOB|nr:TadE/TadG family type IV pilus assembly protein [Pseudodonghicola xiamenensis]GHG93855.1 hypothetical protein GCM10010961_26620 [Pseudodonghicola xiamenensis]
MSGRAGLWHRLSRFGAEEAGMVTIEFVIIFPILVFFLLFIFATSLYIGTASDLQQAVQTLARASVGVLSEGGEEIDLCSVLSTDFLPTVIEQSPLLSLDRITFPTSCADQPGDDGGIHLTMEYSLAGSALKSVAQSVGMEFGTISRSAVVFY